jgi:flavin reductase (DIM6/NTAB) family NADH-FMN oxidoreductase RutF
MKKIEIATNDFLIPMPMALIGSKEGDQANFMAAAWFNRVNARPPMVMVALIKSSQTTSNVVANKEFSINIPSFDLMEKTDYCGIIPGKKENKAELFDLFYCDLKNSPMIRECPLNYACRLTDQTELPSHIVFFAEIMHAYCEEKFMTQEKPDIEKIRPFILSLPDNRYWYVGKYLGNAWTNSEL